jgi:hypothetical protein
VVSGWAYFVYIVPWGSVKPPFAISPASLFLNTICEVEAVQEAQRLIDVEARNVAFKHVRCDLLLG